MLNACPSISTFSTLHTHPSTSPVLYIIHLLIVAVVLLYRDHISGLLPL